MTFSTPVEVSLFIRRIPLIAARVGLLQARPQRRRIKPRAPRRIEPFDLRGLQHEQNT